jgi:hypothetical protein
MKGGFMNRFMMLALGLFVCLTLTNVVFAAERVVVLEEAYGGG